MTHFASLEKLLSVGRALTVEQDLKTLLRQIVSISAEVLQADMVMLYEYWEETGEIGVPPVIWGELRHPDASRTWRERSGYRDSLVFKMLEHEHPFYAPDAPHDWSQLPGWRSPGAFEGFIEREGVASSAAVRLSVDQKRVGVLFVNYRSPHVFMEEEREIIEFIAAQAALAIHNARLVTRERQLRHQADLLHEVSATISSAAGLKEVADKLLEALGQVVEYRKATMQLIQGDVRQLIAYRGFGWEAINQWLLRPISQDALIRPIVERKKPSILSATADVPEWEPHPETLNVQSWVGLPLVYGEQVVGLLTLDHDQSGFYTSAIESRLVPFASQAAIAVKNALLFNDAQRRIRDLQILNAVAQAMSVKLSEPGLLQDIVTQIRDNLGCTSCTYFSLRDMEGEPRLVSQISRGDPEWPGEPARFRPGDESLVGRVFERGTAQTAFYASDRAGPLSAPAAPDQFRTALAAPVKVGDQVIGVIHAHRENEWFDPNDLSLVDALARQAGIAIQRARGLERVQRIANQINVAQESDVILEQIVSCAIELTNTSSGMIYLLDDAGQTIVKSLAWPKGFEQSVLRLNRKDNLIRRVIESGKDWIRLDLSQSPEHSSAVREPIHSLLMMLLRRDQQVIGGLVLGDTDPHDFNETEISLLATLTNQAATAIYKAQLLDELKHQMVQQRVLNQAGATLIDLQDEEAILSRVAYYAARTLRCRHCSVFRVEGEALVVRAAFGERVHVLQPGRAFKLGQGVAGWVALEGAPALVPNTLEDPRFDSHWSDPHPMSLVVVPISVDQKVYGVISAEHTRAGAFSEKDQQLLTAFAQQVSQAVRNGRRINELEALNRAGQLIIGQRETLPLFDTLLDTINDTLKCMNTTLFIVRPTGDLEIRAQRGSPTHSDLFTSRFRRGEGLAGWVAQNRRPLNVPDAERHPLFVPGSHIVPPGHPHSILLVPLIWQEQAIGVISADKDILNGFDESAQRLLETLAMQAVVAYENARLFEQLSSLQSLSVQLMTLDLTALLKRIIESAMRLTQTELGLLYLLSDDGTRIIESVSVPDHFSPSRSQLSESGLTRQIFESGEPIFVADTLKDENVSADVAGWGVRSFFGQPLLKAGKRVIGVLYLNAMELRQFSGPERELIATLTSQAAIAIENARFYQQRERDTRALRKIVQIVGTIGVETDALPVILKAIIESFPLADYGTFALVSPERRQLVFQTVWEGGRLLVESEIPGDRRTRSWNDGIIGYVAREGKSYRTGDVTYDPHHKPWRSGTLSKLVLPLKNGSGRVIGILNLESSKRDAFEPADQELCESLANVATLAIEKGQLYEDLQRRVRYLDALNRVANRIGGVADREEMFKMVVGEARATLVAMRCTLFVLENEVLVPHVSEGMSSEILGQLAFKMGEGLAGWVAQEGVPALVPDVEQDLHFVTRQASVLEPPRSMILAPLWVEGRVTGVISVDRGEGTPFDETDLRFLETLSVQAGIFERQRRRRVDAIHRRYNPYIAGAPIRAPEEFFGRAEFIRSILNSIHNNSFIIYGERRIGKTSVLLQLENQLRFCRQDDPYYFLPVLADLQRVREEHFFLFLRERIEQASGISRSRLSDLRHRPRYTHIDLEADLEIVVGFLEERHPGQAIRIVLLLDEMDEFSGYTPRTHEYFRSLFMSSCGNHIKMVMAGVFIQRVQQPRTSPWYNFSEKRELEPLDESDARSLIVEPVFGYYRYDPPALDSLLKYSDLKPFDIQRLCLLTINAMLDRVGSDIEAAGEAIVPGKIIIRFEDVYRAMEMALREKDGEYQHLWFKFSEEQRQAIMSAAEREGMIALGATRIDGAPLFAREELYNIARFEGRQATLTYLFTSWLKGAPR